MSVVPLTLEALSNRGIAWLMSIALPFTLSTMSTRTMSAKFFVARRNAVVAPTIPAPIMLIFILPPLVFLE